MQVEPRAITVVDNGPGMPPETVTDILDFSIRVSSREAYVAPDRGAQGNALKTILAMPFVLDGEAGRVEICARGLRHQIAFAVDALRQEPVIRHRHEERDVTKGTSITVAWPDSACSILAEAEERFLQIADDYTWLNPHLALTVTWFGERSAVRATDPSWPKWRPSDPTCAHWYTPQHLERLIAAYLAHDVERGRERTVREFVSEFRGLSGSLKQKAVLAATGLQRAPARAAVRRPHDRSSAVEALLDAMVAYTRPVKPERSASSARITCSAGSRRPGARWRPSSTSRSRARTPGCPG